MKRNLPGIHTLAQQIKPFKGSHCYVVFDLETGECLVKFNVPDKLTILKFWISKVTSPYHHASKALEYFRIQFCVRENI